MTLIDNLLIEPDKFTVSNLLDRLHTAEIGGL
jgi:hypothetical protein